MQIYPAVELYLKDCCEEFGEIVEARRQPLQELAAYIVQQAQAGKPAQLTFICTHNSRRSHLAMVWARVAAAMTAIGQVQTFSGGTEATAFNSRAVAALQRCGLAIKAVDASQTNPHYQVRYADDAPPLQCWSKVYNASPNPTREYAAIMVCSSADHACPVVSGSDLRLAIPYEDPKAADGAADEAETYDARCRQIAREMLYVADVAAKRLH